MSIRSQSRKDPPSPRAVLPASFNRCRNSREPGAAADADVQRNLASPCFPPLHAARHVWEEMLLHCQEERPYEACGLFSGKKGRIETIWRMENVRRSPVSFSMDVHEIENVLQAMQSRGERMTGIYHSHPTAPAIPSPEDIAHAHYPEAAYIIVSLQDDPPSWGCYRVIGQRATPIRLSLY